jgi:hypothetical protein
VVALSAVCTHRQCILDLEQHRTSVRGDELLIYLG